jgi:hypothetical protein
MRTPTDRLLLTATILFLLLLVAGLPAFGGSAPDSHQEGNAPRKPQTQPAHSHKSGTAAPATRHAESKKPATTKKKEPEKPLVFTDEDLKKYHSGATPSKAAPPPPPVPAQDPLKNLKDQQERARWRQEKIAQLQQKVLDLEGKLKTLEQKKLSVVNPYVPRPQEGEEEKAEEKGMNGPELLARTEDEIRQTTQDLEAARKELATFQETPSQ